MIPGVPILLTHVIVIFRGCKAWDRETMFSQLAKESARQRFYGRAGKFSAVISPVSAARVQR